MGGDDDLGLRRHRLTSRKSVQTPFASGRLSHAAFDGACARVRVRSLTVHFHAKSPGSPPGPRPALPCHRRTGGANKCLIATRHVPAAFPNTDADPITERLNFYSSSSMDRMPAREVGDEGSIPSCCAIYPRRTMDRTAGYDPANTGSSPVADTKS